MKPETKTFSFDNLTTNVYYIVMFDGFKTNGRKLCTETKRKMAEIEKRKSDQILNSKDWIQRQYFDSDRYFKLSEYKELKMYIEDCVSLHLDIGVMIETYDPETTEINHIANFINKKYC
jgi:hypothetical protein